MLSNYGAREDFWKSPELQGEQSPKGNPTGNQAGIFIGRTDAEVEAPILWPPDVNSHLTGKDLDAGKDRRQKEQQKMKWLSSITDSMGMNLNKLWETLKDRGAWHAVVIGFAKSQAQPHKWTTRRTHTLEKKSRHWICLYFLQGKTEELMELFVL